MESHFPLLLAASDSRRFISSSSFQRITVSMRFGGATRVLLRLLRLDLDLLICFPSLVQQLRGNSRNLGFALSIC